MNIMSKVIGAIGGLALSAAASAAPINVGGIVWDPDAFLDFDSGSLSIVQTIDAVSGVASGYGTVASMNGVLAPGFCPGCELTFHFGGFTPIGATLLPSGGTSIPYSGGWVEFYVDHSADSSLANPSLMTLANTGSEAGANALWLRLEGHAGNYSPATATFIGDVNAAGTQLEGKGFFGVHSGLAAPNFDTDTMLGGADFSFVSTFNTFPIAGSILTSYGVATMDGDSIPEPGTLVLFGLGLLALGMKLRRAKG